MRTSHLININLILSVAILLTACGKSAEPEHTATPVPSATQVPSTPTPPPEDILEKAWQAYQEGDFKIAREIAEEVRDQNREDQAETGDPFAIIGLVELEDGKHSDAIFMFNRALKLGMVNPETDEFLIGNIQSTIENLNDENLSTYSPLTIRPNINDLRDYLELLTALAPQNPVAENYTAKLNPPPFNPENYTEVDLSVDEINTLLDVVYRWNTFNKGNTYYIELNEKYPDNPITMIMLAAYEYYNENYLHALELLSSAVVIEPGITQAWEIMGFSFESIGAMEHAREAYIHCLILDINNHNADNQLKELSTDIRWWPNDFFEDYGFGMYYHGSAPFSITSESASNTAGVAQSEDDFIFFQLSWKTETDITLDDQHLQELMVSMLDANSPRLKGEFQTFDYGEVPMIYRDFSYRILGSSVWADGVIAGWYSEGITYILELRLVEDGYDHDYLNWLLASYIETFTSNP